jgi:uncharacterized membrane protein
MLRSFRLKKDSADQENLIRGKEVSRLECFSDAVFAFALTLLVVSLEVPKSFDMLLETMRGFVAFGICFAILANIWNHHYVFCRRFGLDDGPVRGLTCVLLFVVLLYVYPLKFLFTIFIGGFMGQRTNAIQDSQLPMLFTIYGIGFAAIFLVYMLLYGYAISRKGELHLSPREIFDSRWQIYAFCGQLSVALVSIVLAHVLPARLIGWAGFAYFALGIFMTVHGTLYGRARRALESTAISGHHA